ncbi:MAG: alpha/beta hydrolase-fold protein [Bacteroidota bacterium]
MRKHFFLLTALLWVGISSIQAQKNEVDLYERMLAKTIHSNILSENKIGIDTVRQVHVYLPPSYHLSEHSFPVVYYLHNFFNTPETILHHHKVPGIIEKSVQSKLSGEFIFVVADFTSPTTGSLYENSTTSGLWLDFITKELIPFVDHELRTIPKSDSRAVVGDFMGGRGALKLAMSYPEWVSIVYALHPVATGSGYLPRNSLDVDWEKIHQATSYDEIRGTGRTQIFASICQAFLPNPNRPPLYADFHFEGGPDGTLEFKAEQARKEMKAFHLDETLDENLGNLKKLKAIAFDWGRFDVTQAHVISNRRFSKKLMDLGIDHMGEEFVGNPWNKYWGEEGRFVTRVLPFLSKNLKFE